MASPVVPLAASWIPAAAEIWRAGQLEVYREPESLPAPEDSFEFFRDIVYNGCESWWAVPQGPSIAGILGLKHEHIAHLYVRAESRGLGFGKALVGQAKITYPRALTAFTSARALGFYLNLGFCLDEATPEEVRVRWQQDSDALGFRAPEVPYRIGLKTRRRQPRENSPPLVNGSLRPICRPKPRGLKDASHGIIIHADEFLFMTHRVGIVGHRGYSGAELIRILQHHPHAEPVLLEHREDAGAAPALRNRPSRTSIPCTGEAVRNEGLTAVFLATPPEVSMDLSPVMLEAGARVIDLSGAFRLGTPANYTAWYKEPHTQPALLAEAVYGLPELCRAHIPVARLLSNPGCYPTAANLALAPLVEAGVIDRSAGIVCDAKSGVSGAGRKPSLKTSFCEVTENFSAYSILKHRHVPEVLMISGLEEHEFSFTAQLIPIDRGILETIYFRTSAASADALLAIYEARYASEPFVRLYNPGHVPDLHAVAHTNFCDIGVTLDPKSGRAVVVSAIDNLVKGAAGQAVQNMNLMLGFAETEGLL